MAKKAQRKKQKALLSPRARKLMLPAFFVIGAGVVALTILSVIIIPKADSNSRYGVGANGFRAYVEKNSDLGVKAVVQKDKVVAALGDKAKSVGDADVSKVFNFNDDRSQTVTYPFTRADGVKASVYVDMKLYKNMTSLEDDHIYVATAKAGTVNGHPAYFKHAQTLGSDREYHMIVVNGLKAYRFVMTQPLDNITIKEVAALATLKKIALESKF